MSKTSVEPPFEARSFDYEVEKASTGVAQVVVDGELDLSAAGTLDRALCEAQNGAGVVVLDLRRVSFCDSSGLRALLSAARRARDADQRFIVVPGARQVRSLLEITKANELLEIVDTRPSIGAQSPRLSQTA